MSCSSPRGRSTGRTWTPFRRGLIADSDHRRGGGARAAREVRAGPVRATVRRRRQRRALERPRRASRAGARGGARVHGAAQERAPGLLPLAHVASDAVAVIGTDAAEARLGGYSGPGVGRCLDARRPPRARSARHDGALCARARDAITRTATWSSPASSCASAAERRERCADLTRRVLRQQPARRCAAPDAHRRARGLSAGRSTPRARAFRSTGTRCAGPGRCSVPARRRRAASASRATTAIGCGSTAGSLIDNWRKQSFGTRSPTSRWRRAPRTTCGWSTSRAPAMRA